MTEHSETRQQTYPTGSAAIGTMAGQSAPVLRHTLVVRVTHWINTLVFFSLVISGVAILIAHPRLYWGETGAYGSPALIELPLPLNFEESGWGRSLHFLAAWVGVANGIVYVLSGLRRRHFTSGMTMTYNHPQRLAYAGVVFVLFPLMVISGLAMSPAVTSFLPVIVGMFGGHQSARTIHFVVTNVLLLFFFGHIAMVWRSGFRSQMRGMIRGDASEEKMG